MLHCAGTLSQAAGTTNWKVCTLTKGYVSGVFDMFHIGHLNIIVQAREQCDYLIVGAVTDEVVNDVKNRKPVIPLSERMEILGGLEDVDEVIVDQHSDKYETWKDVRYDIIFKGDDWKDTPKGKKLESDLSKVGAQVVYFPYTKHTSSTMLRHVVEGLAHVPVMPLPGEGDLGVDAPVEQRACPTCGQALGG